MSDAIDTDGQITVRTIKTRHSDALRDLQQNENDRLLRIKNDPSRQISRCNTVNDESNDPGAKCIEDSLPVKQVWAGALEASRLTVGNRLAVTRRDLLSHYDAVGVGYVANKVCNLEKLIILISSTREKVDTTVKAGHQRINQIVGASHPSGTTMLAISDDGLTDLRAFTSPSAYLKQLFFSSSAFQGASNG